MVPAQVLEHGPALSIVIVNYRNWHETARLTRQILQAPETRRGLVEIVIVDNHSPPRRITSHMRRWPEVSVRRWNRNRGFAQAANEGFRLSRGSWILLLNPDITLGLDFLPGLLASIHDQWEATSRAGVVGFRLNNADGTIQGSSGSFPTLFSTLARLVLPRHRRKYTTPPTSEPAQVPWVTGCCFLVRRACVEQLGGFDESYFLYYEDVDLCRRAQMMGWSVWFDPRLSAFHHHPLHSRPVSAKLRLCIRHALLIYSGLHWPRWQFRLLAGIIRLEARFRRWWASRGRERRKARHFQLLQAIIDELVHGRVRHARKRLERVVQQAGSRGKWRRDVKLRGDRLCNKG
jgi:GT2 family glycosyltransferase